MTRVGLLLLPPIIVGRKTASEIWIDAEERVLSCPPITVPRNS